MQAEVASDPSQRKPRADRGIRAERRRSARAVEFTLERTSLASSARSFFATQASLPPHEDVREPREKKLPGGFDPPGSKCER
jgi:hypothetical protein